MSQPHAVPVTAPDLIDPVVGFRQWRLADEHLESLYTHVCWEGPELRASCGSGGHDSSDSPAPSCSCGIYAYYDPCPRTASAGTRDFVAGAVVLWGHIEVHAVGMRAQCARVVALELPVSRGRKRLEVRRLAERLGVVAVPHRALAATAYQQGLRLDRSMRPRRQFERGGSARPWRLPRMTAPFVGAGARRG